MSRGRVTLDPGLRRDDSHLIGALFIIIFLFVATPALAEVSVTSVLVRSGYFQAPECTPTAAPQQFNECVCQANISKAQVAGIEADAAAAINKHLALVPEQLASESCEGAPIAAPTGTVTSFNAASAAYEVAYQSPNLLTVLVTYSTFSAGGVQPLTGTDGFTFDLKSGKYIDPLQYLNEAQLAKLNSATQTELTKKYGDKLREETMTRTEPYVTPDGCDTCTLYYGKDGWTMRFQPYAIAPLAVGEPEINLPADVIAAPETLIAKK